MSSPSLRRVFVLEGDRDHAQALARTGKWGKRGAGCLFLASDTGRLLLAKRSGAVLEPHTWGTWGGAIDEDEDPAEAVQREVKEEAGYTGQLNLIPVYAYKDPNSSFRYFNYLAVVPAEFEPRLDHETEGFEWVEPGDWPSPLHPGLAELVRQPKFQKLTRMQP